MISTSSLEEISLSEGSDIMAENILSQDEVNALLRGLATGDVETKTPEDSEKNSGKAPREYNLASQERVIRGRDCIPGGLFRNSFLSLRAAWSRRLPWQGRGGER